MKFFIRLQNWFFVHLHNRFIMCEHCGRFIIKPRSEKPKVDLCLYCYGRIYNGMQENSLIEEKIKTEYIKNFQMSKIKRFLYLWKL